jgi:hypothetical protein
MSDVWNYKKDGEKKGKEEGKRKRNKEVRHSRGDRR